ncbi:MAG: 16S rRNA (adenine(1518)-N(6)/adenine(1519)-N(6))-dimethyltransferase RsmA [Candidatus Kapabacteria bacterium]|nr:16S rRNA (adenine(1518)-N(6)/adenine(1519)-N(6))-dimethyltransferase RsmA [Candidatus Kapabacteria bacterium]
MKGFAPKRRFSQNFLTDPSTADKIVRELSVKPGDTLVEIGPGTGVLTKRLIATECARLIAIDLDPRSAEHIETQPWFDATRTVIVVGDALKQDLGQYVRGTPREQCAIIGNIPYAITTDLLFSIFARRREFSRAVIMMQREVAKRLVASPGSKEYGILSVATWFCSIASLRFHVSPGAFFPKPDVTSSVVSIELRADDPLPVSFEDYMGFVRAAFSQRRKVLLNALAGWYSAVGKGASIRDTGNAVSMGCDLGRTRAEELSPERLFAVYLALVGGGRHA